MIDAYIKMIHVNLTKFEDNEIALRLIEAFKTKYYKDKLDQFFANHLNLKEFKYIESEIIMFEAIALLNSKKITHQQCREMLLKALELLEVN